MTNYTKEFNEITDKCELFNLMISFFDDYSAEYIDINNRGLKVRLNVLEVKRYMEYVFICENDNSISISEHEITCVRFNRRNITIGSSVTEMTLKVLFGDNIISIKVNQK